MTVGRPRRLWLWLTAGAAAAVLLGALYLLVAFNGVRALERHWRHAEAVSVAFNDYASDSRWDDYQTAKFVIEGASPDPDPVVRYATQEYARELRAEAARVEKVTAVDPGVRSLRRDMAAALRTYAEELEVVARLPKVPPPIFGQRTDITVRALAELKRWRMRPLTKEVAADFKPDATKAAVSPLLDERTGLRLVTVSEKDLITIDLDTGRVGAIWKNWGYPDEFAVSARQGWVAFKGSFMGHAWRPGEVVTAELGTSERFLDGPNPDTVWVVRDREPGTPRKVGEVDRTGRELATVTAPSTATPVGITPAHLVSWSIDVVARRFRAQIVVTDRGTGAQVRSVDDAIPFATHQQLLAFGGGLTDALEGEPDRLAVIDLATGQQRPVAGPDATSYPAAAAFSPDGSALAVLWSQPGTETGGRIGIHPVDTLQAPAFVAADGEMAATSLAWSPANDRLFFLLQPREKSPDGMRIGTMRRSDNVVQRLRIRGAFRLLDAF